MGVCQLCTLCSWCSLPLQERYGIVVAFSDEGSHPCESALVVRGQALKFSQLARKLINSSREVYEGLALVVPLPFEMRGLIQL